MSGAAWRRWFGRRMTRTGDAGTEHVRLSGPAQRYSDRQVACAIPLKGTLQVGYGSLGAGRRDVRCVRRSTSRRRMGVQMPSGRTKGLTKTLCISVRAASGLPVGTCRHASDRHKPGTPTSTSLRAAPTRLISTRIVFLAASGQVRSRCISSRAASGLPQTQCRAVVPFLAQVPDALPGGRWHACATAAGVSPAVRARRHRT